MYTTSSKSDSSDKSNDDNKRKLNSELIYEKYIINGLRYFNLDLLYLERMELEEYEIRYKAYLLKQADEESKLAKLAIFIREANRSENDKYVFVTSNDFIDIKKVENEIFNEPIIDDNTYNLLMKIRR